MPALAPRTQFYFGKNRLFARPLHAVRWRLAGNAALLRLRTFAFDDTVW